MIQLPIDAASGDLLSSSLPNWERVGDKIKHSTNNNIILVRAHNTANNKLEFALFHLSVLDHAYTLPPIPAMTLLKRSMVENILFNLTSALGALSHEINQIYELVTASTFPLSVSSSHIFSGQPCSYNRYGVQESM
jgi:hypothetical protein